MNSIRLLRFYAATLCAAACLRRVVGRRRDCRVDARLLPGVKGCQRSKRLAAALVEFHRAGRSRHLRSAPVHSGIVRRVHHSPRALPSGGHYRRRKRDHPLWTFHRESYRGRRRPAGLLRGVLTSDLSSCFNGAGTPTGIEIVSGSLATHIDATHLGATPVDRCSQACSNLPCFAPLGALTTYKPSCTNGNAVDTGYRVLPGAPPTPPPGVASVQLPQGSLLGDPRFAYHCDDFCTNLGVCYRKGTLVDQNAVGFCSGAGLKISLGLWGMQ